MVKMAVIVAAGFGSRLKEKTQQQPKGFLELEGISLIKRSIDKLLEKGIVKIYIGTGYLSEVYDVFALQYPEIQCIRSDKYASTSSMYTLYNMKESIKEDFLLLESDLLYEKDTLDYLLDDVRKDCILASGTTNSGDEVYIQTDKDMYLTEMSKNKNDLSRIDGELTGISKISYSRYKQMCEMFISCDNLNIDYEYIMVTTARQNPFYVKKIEELIWCEIDDENHLKRALDEILPKIKGKDERD